MYVYIYIYIYTYICHFRACRVRRGNSQRLAKSSPYAGPSAGAKSQVYGSGTFGAFWLVYKQLCPNTKYNILNN